MRHFSLENLVPNLIAIAKCAGDAVMDIYASGNKQEQLKADQSPLTAADLISHKSLVAGLAELITDCPVVSEEDDLSFTHRSTNGCFWLIDPLDGTKEFIAHNGEFTVNIALIDRGCSVLGIVFAPAMDQLYWGGRGLGAYRISKNQTSAIHVDQGTAGSVCRVVASKSHLNPETQLFIDRLGRVALVQAGSSLKFCRVAEGAADIYPRLAPTCEWDTAAAQAVLEGAGGVVVDLEGVSLGYGKPEVLNPSFIATRSRELIPK